MGKKRLGQKLLLKSETLRKLADADLQHVGGGAMSEQFNRCSTASVDKCYGATTFTICAPNRC